MFGCFSLMKHMLWGDEAQNTPTEVENRRIVQIDASSIGTDVVIVKQGKRVCGSGGAVACTAIAQDKAYFEVKIQSAGVWYMGLATKNYNVQKEMGKCSESWAIRNDGVVLYKGEEKSRMGVETLDEGDVIGCSYDHVELKFYRNGKPTSASVSGIKGTVLPAVYVDDGAVLDVFFTDFNFQPPNGFSQILMEKDLI